MLCSRLTSNLPDRLENCCVSISVERRRYTRRRREEKVSRVFQLLHAKLSINIDFDLEFLILKKKKNCSLLIRKVKFFQGTVAT